MQASPIFILDHLELIYGGLAIVADATINSGGDIYPAMLDGIKTVSFSHPLLPLLKAINYACILTFVSLLLFTVTGLSTKSEYAADVEHVVSGLSTEAEKELFSADDAIYLLGVLMVLVGAYFGSLSMGSILQQYDTSLFLLVIPALFFTLVGIPLNLLFDFGILFLMYLRGVATTKVAFFELAYDYIGVVAFFTRLLVQFVRLVLMFVVYFMMHEAVMVYQLGFGAIPFSGSTYNDVFNTS
jgi:hypothetical protein